MAIAAREQHARGKAGVVSDLAALAMVHISAPQVMPILAVLRGPSHHTPPTNDLGMCYPLQANLALQELHRNIAAQRDNPAGMQPSRS